MNEKTSSIFSVAFAVPWCCVVPAGLAVFGLAGTAAIKIILMKLLFWNEIYLTYDVQDSCTSFTVLTHIRHTQNFKNYEF